MKNIIALIIITFSLTAGGATATNLDVRFINQITVEKGKGVGVVNAYYMAGSVTLAPQQQIIRYTITTIQDGTIVIDAAGHTVPLPATCKVTVGQGLMLYFLGEIPAKGLPNLYCQLKSQ